MTLCLGFFFRGGDLVHGILGKLFLLLFLFLFQLLFQFLFLLLLLGVLRVLGRLLSGLDAHVGHGPLGELDAHAVLAGIDHDGVVVHRDDLAYHTADGGDDITLLQAVPHFLSLLLPLVFGADHQEVHQNRSALRFPSMHFPDLRLPSGDFCLQ